MRNRPSDRRVLDVQQRTAAYSAVVRAWLCIGEPWSTSETLSSARSFLLPVIAPLAIPLSGNAMYIYLHSLLIHLVLKLMCRRKYGRQQRDSTWTWLATVL